MRVVVVTTDLHILTRCAKSGVVAVFIASAAFGHAVAPVRAAAFSSTFSPSITIANSCKIKFARRLNFRRHGILDSNVNRRNKIRIKCTSGVNYDVGLDAGATSGGTIAVRKMINGSETVDYMMYQNSARTINWGNTPGVDTKSMVGTGANQNIWVYGRVPPQTTPSPGTYTDTVTVTVTF